MKLLLTFMLTLLINVAYGQSDTVFDCAREANRKGKMIYLKDFQTTLVPVNNTKAGEKWPVILNKGTKYRFYLCEKNKDKPEQIVLKLFDETHPENDPYGSSKKRGHFYFECNKTGTYHVSIRYKKGYGKKETSAIGIMLFVKKKGG